MAIKTNDYTLSFIKEGQVISMPEMLCLEKTPRLLITDRDFRANFTCQNGTIVNGILLCGEVALQKSLSLKSLE